MTFQSGVLHRGLLAGFHVLHRPSSPPHLGLAHEGAGNAEAAQAIFQDVAGHNFNFAQYALIRKEAMEKAAG